MEDDDLPGPFDRLFGSVLAHRMILARMLLAQLIDERDPIRTASKVRDDFMGDLEHTFETADPSATADSLQAHAEDEVSELMKMVIDGLRQSRR